MGSCRALRLCYPPLWQLGAYRRRLALGTARGRRESRTSPPRRGIFLDSRQGIMDSQRGLRGVGTSCPKRALLQPPPLGRPS